MKEPTSAEPPVRRPAEVPSDAMLRVCQVPRECAGQRLDVFIQSRLRNTSRTRARLIVKNSAYALDGRRMKPSERVQADEYVALWRPPLEEDDSRVDIPVLYQDAHLLAVDKPALMTVHPTARYHTSTVLKQLEAAFPDQFFSLIHRLDRETSGVLLLARTPEADRRFKRLLEDRTVLGERSGHVISKTYLAITWGVPPEGCYQQPLEPDAGNSLRVKMKIAPTGLGLEARTDIALLDQARDYALLSCRLHTGRQHQIRVHLAAAGYPVVGDKLYGPDDRMLARSADGELTEQDLGRLELPRHALHAHRYELPHAITGRPLVIESPLPSDLREFWSSRKQQAAERPHDVNAPVGRGE